MKKKKLQLGQSLMQTNGQRRPDQNHPDGLFFFCRDLAIFRQRNWENFGNSVLFW
jgi:hypothetical protein